MKTIVSVGETIGHTIKSTIDKAGHDIVKIERMVVEPNFRDHAVKKVKRA